MRLKTKLGLNAPAMAPSQLNDVKETGQALLLIHPSTKHPRQPSLFSHLGAVIAVSWDLG